MPLTNIYDFVKFLTNFTKTICEFTTKFYVAFNYVTTPFCENRKS